MTHKSNIVYYPINSNYRIRAVTYEVAAFFYEDGQCLKDKIQRLLLEDVHQNPNRTFAENKKKVDN